MDAKEEQRLHELWLESNGEYGRQRATRPELCSSAPKELSTAAVTYANLSDGDVTEDQVYRKVKKAAQVTGLSAILEEHRTWLYSRGKRGKRAILSGLSLIGADLHMVALEAAILRYTNLGVANLRMASLKTADLRSSALRGADLSHADLRGADLTDADLLRANLEGANLAGADLRGANLQEANLAGANLSGADLRRANLTGTPFEPKPAPPQPMPQAPSFDDGEGEEWDAGYVQDRLLRRVRHYQATGELPDDVSPMTIMLFAEVYR